jgi:hypothetical protein
MHFIMQNEKINKGLHGLQQKKWERWEERNHFLLCNMPEEAWTSS